MDETRVGQVVGAHPNVIADHQLAMLIKIEQHARIIKGWVIFFGLVVLLGVVLPALAFLRAY